MRRDLPGLLALGTLFVLCAIVIWLAGRPLATDDAWWHLALGRVYAEHGPFVDHDPLFHTAPDQPTRPQEWLFQVALHAVRSATGFHGLRVLHAAAAAAILAFAFACFRRAAPSLASAALATALFACLAWYRLFQLRPDLVSIPATFALYALLLVDERPPGARRIAAATLLFAVWANAHPLFAVGLALLFAAILGLGLEALLARILRPGERGPGRGTRAQRLGIALALGAVAALANPRGAGQHATFFVESASGDIWLLLDDFLHFDPLAPPSGNLAITPLAWLATDLTLAAFAVVTGHGFARLLRERSAKALHDLDALHLGLAAAGAVAMVVAARFLWLVAFPLLYLLRWQRTALARRPAAARPAAWAAAAGCAALALAFPRAIRLDAFALEAASEREGYWRSPWLDDRYCGAGAAFLRDAGLEGNLFHPFHLGGFLGYWLAPRLRTFIDGRLDHVPSEVLHDYLQIRQASHRGVPQALRDLLEKWRVDVYVGLNFPQERYADASWVAHLRRFPAWIPIFANEHCGIYLRRAPGSEENLRRVAAYYATRRLPFDPRHGIDASELIRRRPGWARRQRLIPDDHDALLEASRAGDRALRAAALDRLGELYWRIGAFRDGARVDGELLELAPDHREARRRRADDLLLLGRPCEALETAQALYDLDPDHGDIHAIRQIAQNLCTRDGDGAAGPQGPAAGSPKRSGAGPEGPAPPKRSHRRATLPPGNPAVPSPKQGLTSVFGMGTGVAPALWAVGKANQSPASVADATPAAFAQPNILPSPWPPRLAREWSSLTGD